MEVVKTILEQGEAMIDFEKQREFYVGGGITVKLLLEVECFDIGVEYFGYAEMDGDKIRCPGFWHKDGKCWSMNIGYAVVDIVEEKPKPVVDWSAIPDYVKYLAKDGYGDWYGYSTKPIKSNKVWLYPSDGDTYAIAINIKEKDHPVYNGLWEDSPIRRPDFIADYNEEIRIPWDKIPEKYSVIAMDEDGQWFVYSYVPRPLRIRANIICEWSRYARNVRLGSSKEYELTPFTRKDFNYKGEWCDSVFIRPGCDPVRDIETI